jgi:hypothetical protein
VEAYTVKSIGKYSRKIKKDIVTANSLQHASEKFKTLGKSYASRRIIDIEPIKMKR